MNSRFEFSVKFSYDKCIHMALFAAAVHSDLYATFHAVLIIVRLIDE